MTFHHLSGTRATEVDVVSVGAHRELILGRASSAAVRFDARRDGMVGRHHARITWTPNDPTSFGLVDLGSRNGTFVNGERVVDRMALSRGDVLRFGASGPEVKLDWDSDS